MLSDTFRESDVRQQVKIVLGMSGVGSHLFLRIILKPKLKKIMYGEYPGRVHV